GLGSQTLRVTAGTMNFVPRGASHWTQSHGAHLVRFEVPDTALAMSGASAQTLDRPSLLGTSTPISLARRVAAEVRGRDHGWRLVAQGLLMELLGHVVRDRTPQATRGIPRWLKVAKDRLDSDYRGFVSLGELARAAGVHPVHLARVFRAAYGSSIGEYKRERQLRAAEQRLLQSADELCDVAASCGFADQSHFSKAFRRAYGVSPGRYRRAHRP